MAWRCSGKTNDDLIQNLWTNGLITSDRVKQAMLQVDRAHYAPTDPYADSPQPIGHSATISAPHMHASAAESLLPYLHPGARVLDIGAGSGYLTSVLAHLVQPGGTVIGVEHIASLVDLANTNLKKSASGKEQVATGAVRIVKGDGRKGWAEGAPYDAIHVGAAAAGGLEGLVEQLRAPGRLFVPVAEGELQHVWVVDKKGDGSVERRKLYGVRYVPLTDEPS